MNQKDYWERENLNKRRPPTHPVVAAYVFPKIDMIKQYIRITKDTHLLDVGCGSGFFTFYFDQICDTYGVDCSEKMLQMNPVKKKFLMDANNLQFRDNTFDIVFCSAFLHHVDDIEKIIREMTRISKKYVVVLEPNRNNPFMFLFSCLVREERKTLQFSLSFLTKAISQSNLKIIVAFSTGLIVPNKTPFFLLPLLKLFDFRFFWGITNFVIAKKMDIVR